MTVDETTSPAGKSVKRWSGVLMTLALGAIAVSSYAIGGAMLGDDFKLGLETSTGVRVLTRADLSWGQLATVVLIVGASDLCLVYGMWQIVLLARRFAHREILTCGVVHCLQRFGWGLFAMGLSEAAMFPTLNAYLVGQGLIDPIKDLAAATIGSGTLTSMMAAVLVMVLAKIFQAGIRLREDAELTI